MHGPTDLLPYWLLYAMWMAGAVQFTRGRFVTNSRVLFTWATVLTALLIGLRFQVGGDWGAYENIYYTIYFLPLGDALSVTDPGYSGLNWLFSQVDVDVWAVNLVCGILFMAGTGRLASRQPNPWLAILVAVPYLIIVVAMGYTRQAAAIGIICWALADASERRLLRLVGFVAAAALFHKTAILMLPLMLLPVLRKNFLIGAIGAAAFMLLFGLVLGGSSDRLVTSYAQSDYDSQGAAIRISMNVLAAVLMLALRNRLGFDRYGQSFWTYNAVAALASVAFLLLLTGSAGVDRLSLFLIPLQLVVFSRLPYALSSGSQPSGLVFAGVLAYSFAVQAVWLNFATNAQSWVPYHSIFARE